MSIPTRPMSNRILSVVVAGVICLISVSAGSAAPKAKQGKGLYTNPQDPALPVDFKIQGEYVGQFKSGDKVGVQVISLGGDAFQAVLYPGGLPGAGWDGKNRSLLDGRLDGGKAVFKPAEGKKKYLAGPPEQFSATSKFPPVGHKPYEGHADGKTMVVESAAGDRAELKKTVRQSPTLGKKPPQGAVVLFDGSDTDAWRGGRLDKETRLLNTDGKDILTTQQFKDYTMHVEFLLPYKPAARGQGRGNSGFYQVDHYEVQILDSFGLEGKNNECGGIYSKKASDVNMCLPPLVWQTYDVEFTAARVDENGKKVKPAVITLRHNGVVVHDAYEIPGKTGGSRRGAEGTPGPIKLQGHGNPLQFRNIWIVEKK